MEYINENQLSIELNKKFGYSVNTFRHCFITFIAKEGNLSLNKRRDIAEKMGHEVIEPVTSREVKSECKMFLYRWEKKIEWQLQLEMTREQVKQFEG